jgi:DNA-binding response OmpR family regulator
MGLRPLVSSDYTGTRETFAFAGPVEACGVPSPAGNLPKFTLDWGIQEELDQLIADAHLGRCRSQYVSSFNQKPINTIDFNDRDKRKLIEELKAQKSNNQAAGPGRAMRVKYGASSMTVSIANPGGNMADYVVIPRNLSRYGVAFFHGRFIYTDSKCKIILPTLDGETITMEGKIVRCIHLTGMIHEVAAVFNTPVDLELFTKLSTEESDENSDEYHEDVASGKIECVAKSQGDILVVDSSKLERKLYGTVIDKIHFSCLEADNDEEAQKVISDRKVTAVIVDVCREPEYGLGLISQLRDDDFKGPIIATSADDDSATRESALSAGAEAFLPKPIDLESLMETLSEQLRVGVPEDDEEPIISTYHEDESMWPLLKEFAKNAEQMVDQLNSLALAQDSTAIRVICRQLKGAGGGYGFEQVTTAAIEVLDAIEESQDDADAIRESVDELLGVLRRIRVG